MDNNHRRDAYPQDKAGYQAQRPEDEAFWENAFHAEEEDGEWYVFGTTTGFAYRSPGSEQAAEEMAQEMHDDLVAVLKEEAEADIAREARRNA